MKKIRLCSACLLGINCRFDGKTKANEKVLELAKKEILIPICPEVFGGMATPRLPAEVRDGKVFETDGTDVTEFFQKGAREVLKIAKLYGVKKAILKQRSPSCGNGQLRMFNREIVKGNGITADLLIKNGIEIISEEDL